MDSYFNEVILKSKDGTEFKLARRDVELSEYIQKVMRDKKNADNNLYYFMELDSKTLENVVKYLKHHRGFAPLEIEKPLRSTNLNEVTDDWSAEYISTKDIGEILDLSFAANFLEIMPLLDLICARIAILSKDKPVEEIMHIFGVKKELTEEEKSKLKEEHKWIEDL